MRIYLFFETERKRASWGGAERERETIPSRLWAVSTEPNAGLRLTNLEITI